MERDFWLQKWQNNEIAFHEGETNTLLRTHFQQLGLEKGARIFVPLCGKTRDIAWLLTNGYRVAGVELSQLAVEQLFTELGVEPRIAEVGPLRCYSSGDIDIFVGDIFDLSTELLGSVDAVYDRAALVALPEEIRRRYVAHLLSITRKAPQLLITLEYDQQLMEGPPFSIGEQMVSQYYANDYRLSLMESKAMPGGLKEVKEVWETLWLLRPANPGLA